MTDNPYESPETASPAQGPKRSFFPGKLVLWLGGIAIALIFFALLLPNGRHPREAARRMQCQINLKQIALALQNYHDDFNSFPPAYTVDATGKPLHSWRTLILPYFGERALYEKVDLTKPWDDPANLAVGKTRIAAYHCPSNQLSPDQTTYLAVAGANGCFNGSQPRTLAEITDGSSNTLLVIEVDAGRAVPWMSPTDASEPLILNLGKSKQLPHPAGCEAAFADGHTQLLPPDLSPATLRALISINGNDNALVEEF